MPESENSAVLEHDSQEQISGSSVSEQSASTFDELSAQAQAFINALPSLQHDNLLDYNRISSVPNVNEELANITDYQRNLITRKPDIIIPYRENIYRSMVKRKPSIDDEDIMS